MYILVIEDKDGNITDEYTFEEGDFTLGRSRQCDIILPSDNVSRKHAQLFTRGGELFVRDLGSANGILVEGKHVTGVHTLGPTAHITLGDYQIHIEQSRGEGGTTGSMPAGVRLTGLNLGVQGRYYGLDNEVNLVGRGRDCSTTIIDPSVSRIHAKISTDDEGILWLEDLKSANGTFVEGVRIEKSAIRDQDVLRFGNVELRLETVAGASPIPEPRPEQTASGIQPMSQEASKSWIYITVGAVAVAALLSGVALFWTQIFGEDDKPTRQRSRPAPVAPATPSPVEKPKVLGPASEDVLAQGEALLKERQWKDAIKKFDLLLKRDPLSKKYRQLQQEAALEDDNRKSMEDGSKDLKMNFFGDAMKSFRQVTGQSVYYNDAQAEIKDLLKRKSGMLKKAKRECRKRRYQACSDLYTDALSIDPNDEKVRAAREKALRKIRR